MTAGPQPQRSPGPPLGAQPQRSPGPQLSPEPKPIPGGLLLGDGPRRVAVLHGWLGGADSWSPLWPHLDGQRFTYAFLDFRGYGGRIGEAGEHTMDEAARDVLARLDHLGWDEFSLVAHSMGGVAAQLVMAAAPQRVCGLFGVSPVPASGSPLGPREAVFRKAVVDLTTRAAIFGASTGGKHEEQWCEAMAAASAASTSPAALDSYLTSWTGADITERIAGITTPVSVVVGEHDPAYPLERVRQTWGRCYPTCELHVLADAGHYPMDENPSALAELMQEFLSRTPS